MGDSDDDEHGRGERRGLSLDIAPGAAARPASGARLCGPGEPGPADDSAAAGDAAASEGSAAGAAASGTSTGAAGASSGTSAGAAGALSGTSAGAAGASSGDASSGRTARLRGAAPGPAFVAAPGTVAGAVPVEPEAEAEPKRRRSQ